MTPKEVIAGVKLKINSATSPDGEEDSHLLDYITKLIDFVCIEDDGAEQIINALEAAGYVIVKNRAQPMSTDI